jgi:copper transport protein
MSWDGQTVLFAAARWLSYLAAFVVVGGVVFRYLVLPRASDDPATRRVHEIDILRLATVGALVLILAHLLRLYCQARSLLDPDNPVTFGVVGTLLNPKQGKWGPGWIAQTISALLAFLGASLGRKYRAGGWLLVLGAVGIVLAAPRTGHAVGLPQAGRIGYPLDLLHFGLGAAWLGTLAVMVIVGLPGHLDRRIHPKQLVTAFSPVALVSSGVGIVLGGVIAWRYLGGFAPFVNSTYGRTVLIKVLALGGVAALGAYNWRVAQPRLHRGEPTAVQRSAGAEVIVGIVLLAITAVLVNLALPGEE